MAKKNNGKKREFKNERKTKILLLSVFVIGIIMSAAGCGAKGSPDAFSSYSEASAAAEDPGFAIPKQATLDDFTWAFNPASYDSSGEILFENPIAAAGTWEMVIWRMTEKGGAQKDVYWINIALEGSDGKMLEADPEYYAYQAFLNSDEAKNAGIKGSDATAKLLEALQAGDGSVKAQVTVVLAGIEDNDSNWKSYVGKPVQLEGKYYPERMFIKAQDKKGNEFTANNFLAAGDEHHAIGAYTPAGNKVGLHGAVYLWRKFD